MVDLKAGLSLPVIVSYIILRYRNTQKIFVTVFSRSAHGALCTAQRS